MRNADLPKKEQWQLLIDTIANEENAFSIGWAYWREKDLNPCDLYPEDSFRGKCGTPSCVSGWARHLELDIFIPIEISMPTPENSNAEYNYDGNEDWFTRKKTVAMLKHYLDTIEWYEDGKRNLGGEVDWLIDERASA